MTPGTSTALDESLTYVQGDTWGGIPGITIRVNGAAPVANVASAKMQFRPDAASSDTVVELTSAAAQISITSVSAWTFVVPAQSLLMAGGSPLAAGSYTWGFQTVDVNGVLLTWLEGTQLALPKAVY